MFLSLRYEFFSQIESTNKVGLPEQKHNSDNQVIISPNWKLLMKTEIMLPEIETGTRVVPQIQAAASRLETLATKTYFVLANVPKHILH